MAVQQTTQSCRQGTTLPARVATAFPWVRIAAPPQVMDVLVKRGVPR